MSHCPESVKAYIHMQTYRFNMEPWVKQHNHIRAQFVAASNAANPQSSEQKNLGQVEDTAVQQAHLGSRVSGISPRGSTGLTV